MVVDRDRMIYTPERVERILTELTEREKAEGVFGKPDEEARFLRHCLKFLDAGERDIIEKTYLEGVSVRKYSRLSGFSRNFISKQRDRTIELLTKFFNVKFCS